MQSYVSVWIHIYINIRIHVYLYIKFICETRIKIFFSVSWKWALNFISNDLEVQSLPHGHSLFILLRILSLSRPPPCPSLYASLSLFSLMSFKAREAEQLENKLLLINFSSWKFHVLLQRQLIYSLASISLGVSTILPSTHCEARSSKPSQQSSTTMLIQV